METAPELTIRKATVGDAPAVHRVFCQSIDEIDDRFYSREQREAWKDAVAPESWSTRILELHLFVAELTGEVVGFVSWYGREIVHIYTVGHTGVGSKLMAFALAEIGPGEVTLTSSLNAEGFYERYGFVRRDVIEKERGGVLIPCIRMSTPQG